jgi:amino acid adenylation domain-containing protein
VERSLASVSEKCRVFNMYGPTEATIISAVLEIDREGYREFKRLSGIPIGKPVANLRMFVLDNNCRLCPVNVAGELYIAGRGVASGYLNRPKLTKDSFISFASGQLFEKSWTKTFVDVGAGLAPARDSSVFDGQPQGLPLQLSNSSTHQLLYKTGDLVRWLPDGNIEFLGRIDHQVKIRGFRIEPGEIENRLLEHEGVKEAVVIDLTTSEGEKYLCAYIVAQNPDHVGANLRRFLAHNLPNYMIPSHFIFIDNIPLNPNGKVDRKALPVPDLSEGATGYTPPENGMQKKLVDIWSRVLDVLPASIGIDTNFFEIGGHSLKATLMAAKIHKELNASIKLVDIFKMPTIGELAHYIEAAAPEKFESISPAVEKTFYPLSAAQERMYILQQMDTDNTVYNIPVAMLVEGEINREKIAGAFEKLIDRHESLRTSFTIVDEQPVQIIHKAEDIDFKIEEHEEAQERKGIFHKSLWKIRIDAPRQPLSINQTLRTVETQNLASQYEESPTPDKSQLASSIIGCFIRPFDLSQAPLLRVGLIKLFTPLSTGNAVFHILVVDQHHIISDGHSMGIMIKEFISLLKGENLPPVTFQYKNYSEWLSARQGKKVLDRQEAFWLGEFAGEIPVLDLPTDFPRPAMQDFAGKHISFELSSEEIEALKALALQENATLYMVLLAVFNILLSKLSGQQDIIVGTPVVGRRHEDLSQILGMFVNTLALRNNPSGEKRFLDFIRETRDKASAAFENQEYPFEELVERVAVNRDMSRNPLFDVMLSRQDMDIAGIEIPGLKLVSLEYESNISKFDLTLQILEVEEKLRLSFEYCTKLFRERTILRYTNYFRKIVSTVITDPEMEIIGIEIISEEEKQDILNKYNNTRTAFTEDKTIHEIFAEQVAKNPHKTALVYENNHLSFEELNRKSNRPAQFLRSKGVLPDTIVGIIIERSLEMITGILGILKSGGAYMPVNPDYPGDRIRLILRDSGTRFLVTDRPEVEGIDFAGEVVHIGDEVSYPGTGNIKNLDIVNTPLDLVYVIYTSGSTGTPKGTLIEHRSVVNILENLEELYPLKEYGAYLLKTNYMFDVSVTELFGWIFGEGKLVILEAGKEGDSEVIAAVVRCGNVTHINFVPSMLKVFLDSLAEDKKGIPESLEYVLAAGEAFPESLAKRAALLGTAVRFENIYGPTEATIYTTGYSLDLREEIDKVPIGKPLHNTWNYIIDESLHLQALNISGELCIGGVGLARGYLNRPELTRDRFINNPFIKGERLYRTGDLTRWLPDGSIEYLGRMDHQVKIRGFRIELEEIENQLLSHEKVKEVVVTAGKLEDGDNYLCAYIVAKSAEPVGVPGTTELREYLSKHLPDHMIPSYFLQLAKIPLTPNGKTDRKALPEPEIKPGQDYVPPRDKIEEKLVETWSDGLGIGKDKIGIHANFFELGGHSLKAAVIVSKINKELNTTLTLKEFFSARSIKGLAEYLKVAANTGYDSIYPVEKKTHYELSSAQNRLYILQQIDSKDISYNMPLVFTIQGKLDRRKFENIMQRIINRHETLRTYFCETDGETAQKITGHINFRIEYEKIDQNNDIKNKIKDCIKPFDLSTPPLLRVALFELTEEKYIVLFDIHHIISDGSSMELLIDEFARLYEGESRPPLRVQYKDYAAWQNRIARGGKRKEQEAYWLKKLENFSFTRLPIDNFQSYNQVDGKQEPLIFDASTTKKIEKFCGRHNITKFVFLITVFQVVLSKEIDQVDITIGIPASIRSHFDLKHLLGIFLNVVLIRTIIDDNDTFLHHLSKSGDNILEALDNQDYPYEMLVSNMREHENSKENELFSILFNYFSQERSDSIRTGDIEIRPYSTDDISPKYDITLYVQDQSECTRMNLVYKANLYDEYTIRAVLDNFLHIVHSVLDNEEIKLSEIDSLGGVDTDDFDKDFEIYN